MKMNCLNALFQSTRPHGARRVHIKTLADLARFQSTRPHGARPLILRLAGIFTGVSIHAPARGATCGFKHHLRGWWCFNPRARTGRDMRDSMGKPVYRRFNPRARTGRDCSASLSHLSPIVSIHAPARGATALSSKRAAATTVSIHAPARGATRWWWRWWWRR